MSVLPLLPGQEDHFLVEGDGSGGPVGMHGFCVFFSNDIELDTIVNGLKDMVLNVSIFRSSIVPLGQDSAVQKIVPTKKHSLRLDAIDLSSVEAEQINSFVVTYFHRDSTEWHDSGVYMARIFKLPGRRYALSLSLRTIAFDAQSIRYVRSDILHAIECRARGMSIEIHDDLAAAVNDLSLDESTINRANTYWDDFYRSACGHPQEESGGVDRMFEHRDQLLRDRPISPRAKIEQIARVAQALSRYSSGCHSIPVDVNFSMRRKLSHQRQYGMFSVQRCVKVADRRSTMGSILSSMKYSNVPSSYYRSFEREVDLESARNPLLNQIDLVDSLSSRSRYRVDIVHFNPPVRSGRSSIIRIENTRLMSNIRLLLNGKFTIDQRNELTREALAAIAR